MTQAVADGFAFCADNSFLGVARHQMDSPFAVAGVPYDGAVSNRPGARFAPEAIRRASRMLCDGEHPLFDLDRSGQPLPMARTLLTDYGDLNLPNTSLAESRRVLQKLALPLIQRHHMLWLGGDHSITLPLLRMYRQHYGQALALVHLDAHCDTWKDHFGEPSGHGTWAYEALQEELILPAATVQIGIRSSGCRAAREYVNQTGGRIFTARELRGLETTGELKFLVDDIRQRMQTAGNPPLYLTIDIDCLDPAFAPGTGTPEPGGLTTNQVLSLLEQLHDLPWVGMDCVEVAPAYDTAELTSNAAACLVWTHLCGLIAARQNHSLRNI